MRRVVLCRTIAYMKGTSILALGLSLLLAAWASQASARGFGVAGDVGLGGLGVLLRRRR